jgi:nuclear GTP-binding protein
VRAVSVSRSVSRCLTAMGKQTTKGAAVKGKPKHSLDEGRRDGKNGTRTAATVRRLKMYKSRPIRNSKGHMLYNQYQSKALPSTRIQPDRRWFGTFLFFLIGTRRRRSAN